MKLKIYKFGKPHAVISEIIELQSDSSRDTNTHFVPPFVNPEIILYIGNQDQIKKVPYRDGFIKGPFTCTQKIEFNAGYHFLSLRLYPFGLKQLLNIDASKFQNSVQDIVTYPLFQTLFDSIKKAGTITPELLATAAQLIEHSDRFPISSSTLNFLKMAQAAEIKNIKKSTLDIGIGLRTLQRNFKKEVGLTPKEFLKINRINSIEQQLEKNTPVLQLIADFDFTDQAHLIKEFKKLRNITPQGIKKSRMFLQDQLVKPEVFIL
ncbi:MAG: AraC family transcriptional regulator [Bacteroidetes bacterium]|nr:AraC family transcriptional regulator [Bacteroidota bacterium]